MESREGAVRSSSRESDRQMGSEGEEEEGWRLAGRVGVEVSRDGVEVMVRGGFWIHRPSYRTEDTQIMSKVSSHKNKTLRQV